MNKLHILLCTAALGAAATVASAQTAAPADPPRGGRPGPHGHGPGGRGGHPVIRVVDADHNGEISAAELANAAASIRTLDTNGDGIVSADELHPAPPALPAGASAPTRPAPPINAHPRPVDDHRPADPVMVALDANGDGALSANEIANAPTSLSALDLNKDGKLTPDELRPLPPAK